MRKLFDFFWVSEMRLTPPLLCGAIGRRAERRLRGEGLGTHLHARSPLRSRQPAPPSHYPSCSIHVCANCFPVATVPSAARAPLCSWACGHTDKATAQLSPPQAWRCDSIWPMKCKGRRSLYRKSPEEGKVASSFLLADTPAEQLAWEQPTWVPGPGWAGGGGPGATCH